MKKLSPSLTWRHQDTSTRTNGKRPRATVSWVLGWPSVCASQTRGLGARREAGRPRGVAGPVWTKPWQTLLSDWRGPHGGRDGAGSGQRAGQASEVQEGDSAWPQAQKRHVEEEMAPWPSPVPHSWEGLPPTLTPKRYCLCFWLCRADEQPTQHMMSISLRSQVTFMYKRQHNSGQAHKRCKEA